MNGAGAMGKAQDDNYPKKKQDLANLIDENVDLSKYIEPTFEDMDYDDVIDYDKRGFCEYFGENF